MLTLLLSTIHYCWWSEHGKWID